jgi:hypothetical protein
MSAQQSQQSSTSNHRLSMSSSSSNSSCDVGVGVRGQSLSQATSANQPGLGSDHPSTSTSPSVQPGPTVLHRNDDVSPRTGSAVGENMPGQDYGKGHGNETVTMEPRVGSVPSASEPRMTSPLEEALLSSHLQNRQTSADSVDGRQRSYSSRRVAALKAELANHRVENEGNAETNDPVAETPGGTQETDSRLNSTQVQGLETLPPALGGPGHRSTSGTAPRESFLLDFGEARSPDQPPPINSNALPALGSPGSDCGRVTPARPFIASPQSLLDPGSIEMAAPVLLSETTTPNLGPTPCAVPVPLPVSADASSGAADTVPGASLFRRPDPVRVVEVIEVQSAGQDCGREGNSPGVSAPAAGTGTWSPQSVSPRSNQGAPLTPPRARTRVATVTMELPPVPQELGPLRGTPRQSSRSFSHSQSPRLQPPNSLAATPTILHSPPSTSPKSSSGSPSYSQQRHLQSLRHSSSATQLQNYTFPDTHGYPAWTTAHVPPLAFSISTGRSSQLPDLTGKVGGGADRRLDLAATLPSSAAKYRLDGGSPSPTGGHPPGHPSWLSDSSGMADDEEAEEEGEELTEGEDSEDDASSQGWEECTNTTEEERDTQRTGQTESEACDDDDTVVLSDEVDTGGLGSGATGDRHPTRAPAVNSHLLEGVTLDDSEYLRARGRALPGLGRGGETRVGHPTLSRKRKILPDGANSSSSPGCLGLEPTGCSPPGGSGVISEAELRGRSNRDGATGSPRPPMASKLKAATLSDLSSMGPALTASALLGVQRRHRHTHPPYTSPRGMAAQQADLFSGKRRSNTLTALEFGSAQQRRAPTVQIRGVEGEAEDDGRSNSHGSPDSCALSVASSTLVPSLTPGGYATTGRRTEGVGSTLEKRGRVPPEMRSVESEGEDAAEEEERDRELHDGSRSASPMHSSSLRSTSALFLTGFPTTRSRTTSVDGNASPFSPRSLSFAGRSMSASVELTLMENSIVPMSYFPDQGQ